MRMLKARVLTARFISPPLKSAFNTQQSLLFSTTTTVIPNIFGHKKRDEKKFTTLSGVCGSQQVYLVSKATWCLTARSCYAPMLCINLSNSSLIDNGSFSSINSSFRLLSSARSSFTAHISAIYHFCETTLCANLHFSKNEFLFFANTILIYRTFSRCVS